MGFGSSSDVSNYATKCEFVYLIKLFRQLHKSGSHLINGNVMLSVEPDSRPRIWIEVEASLPEICWRGRDSSHRSE
jgi:hypothetical protein